MEVRKDILGRSPKIGDTIAFNPPTYKGIVTTIVTGFSKAGLPMFDKRPAFCGSNSPKTGFVIVKIKENE